MPVRNPNLPQGLQHFRVDTLYHLHGGLHGGRHRVGLGIGFGLRKCEIDGRAQVKP